MQYIGHPILGDTLYGKESTLINRQALHAYQIRCIHPITNKELIVNAPIAEDMKII
jgi:23S rRNA pseudouridine1911/1915/1917 synthase